MEKRFGFAHAELADMTKSAEASVERRLTQTRFDGSEASSTLEATVEQLVKRCRDDTERSASLFEVSMEQRLRRTCAEAAEASSGVKAAETFMEQRLRQKQIDAVDLVRSFEATCEQRLRSCRDNASRSSEAWEAAIEQRLRLTSAEAARYSSDTEAFESLVENRLHQCRVDAAETSHQLEALVEQRLRRSQDEAVRSTDELRANIDARLRLANAKAADLVKNAEVSVESRLRRSQAEASEAARAVEALADRFLEQSTVESNKTVEAIMNIVETGWRRTRTETVDAADAAAAQAAEACARRGTAEIKNALEVVMKAEDNFAAEVTACTEEVRSAVFQGPTHSDYFAARLGEAHGTANEAWAAAKELRDLLDDNLAMAAENALVHTDTIQRAERAARMDAEFSAEQHVVTFSAELRDELQRVRHEVTSFGLGEATEMRIELAAEHRCLRNEVEEQLHRLTRLERRSECFEDGALVFTCGTSTSSPTQQPLRGCRGGAGSAASASICESPRVAESSRVSKTGAARIVELSSQVARLQRESRDAICQAERRLTETQWTMEQRLETVTRLAEQHRLADQTQRGELWKEVRDLRGAVGELRSRCGGASTVGGTSLRQRLAEF
eukprot:TRINITY_DN16174_c0_g1_i2.p1 TRINITY_DN16174_c0_g1~~TRINITY_DN16174_c0_g1_i2.p1  ORF type:complete len:681 (+),score=170.15 TRINITY_DN16174_c0_g1_i2:194-2044(+)